MVSQRPEQLDPREGTFARLRVSCLRGDFDAAEGLLAEGPNAWATFLAVCRHATFPDRIAAPTDEALLRHADAPAEMALACVELERLALLAFDPRRHAQLLEIHRGFAQAAGSATATLYLAAGELGQRLLGADLDDFEEQAAALAKEAREHHLADLVVTSTVLRALVRASRGELDEALDVARRACRMARAESLPQQEYLAHITLARVRRLLGHSHLALRILSALEQVATPSWLPWLRWELTLAGGESERGHPELVQWLAAARKGDRATFAQARHGLERMAVGFAPLQQDLEVLAVALDPACEPTTTLPTLAAWLAGNRVALPQGLQGLAAGDGSEEAAASYVVFGPGRAPRRLLAPGLPLAVAAGAERLLQTRRVRGRVETLVAVLALAGPAGLEPPECFARAYGFPYVKEMHDGVFQVALHRVRSHLGEHAQLERSGDRLTLVPRRLLVVPDPRSSRPVTDRVLRILALEGAASAKDTSKRLGVALRTVQGALKELAQEGVCLVKKDGRAVQYVVEDTTFSETTLRLRSPKL